MFRYNKTEKEYIKKINKIQIPKINDEQFIDNEVNKESYKFKKLKPFIKVACICGIILFSAVVLNYNNLLSNIAEKGYEQSSDNDMGFSIKAYASNGEESVDIVKDKIVELPSGYFWDGQTNRSCIDISGEKIKNIKASCVNGIFAVKDTQQDSNGTSETITGPAYDFSMDPVLGPFAEKYYYSIKGSDLEAAKEEIKKIESGELTIEDAKVVVVDRKKNEKDNLNQNTKFGAQIPLTSNDEEQMKKNIENKEVPSTTIKKLNKNELDLDFSGKEVKHSILWSPSDEINKELNDKDIKDYSKIKGDNIKVTVTFEDGTVKEAMIKISFTKNGNIKFKLM